jgi:tRNA pseudouridine13 synthase
MDPSNRKLPYISEEIEGIGGKIKDRPENFIVEEVPLYSPDGEGEHLFIHLTKRGISTKTVQNALAQVFRTDNRNVHYAGIKDKHAVASQYFSVWLRNHEDKNRVYEVEEAWPVRIHSLNYHRKKLKQGHLLGNAFSIKITEVECSPEESMARVQSILEVIRRQGLPNFYGDQRFGMEGDNARKGYEIVTGKRKLKNRWLARFLKSAYQSHLFNCYMVSRIQEGLYQTMLTGDIAKKHDTGGIFVVEDGQLEQERLDNKEICYTGPIFGKKMKPASGKSAWLEEQVLSTNGITMETFRAAGMKGTRRQAILVPDIMAELEDGGIRFRFTLPKGAYATIVLREFMKQP